MASFKWPPGGGSGGGLISFGKVGSIAATPGSASVSVTFGVPLVSSSYRIAASLVNTVDVADDLLFLNYVVTAKSTSGFTILFNAPLTSNYSIDYAALGDT